METFESAGCDGRQLIAVQKQIPKRIGSVWGIECARLDWSDGVIGKIGKYKLIEGFHLNWDTGQQAIVEQKELPHRTNTRWTKIRVQNFTRLRINQI